MKNESSPLGRLHVEVSNGAARLQRVHSDRLQCKRGCAQCCVDGITVFEIEAGRIRERHAELLARAVPHTPGACAFLDDEGACRIYDDRPYVCRTQGLPLRWIETEGRHAGAELRDICPLNEVPGQPIEKLPESDCWTLGPCEGRLAQLQVESGGAPPRRVALRELFGSAQPPD